MNMEQMDKVIVDQQLKIMKLKRMRKIATGLLLLMFLIFVIFKRFETYNLFFSSLVAFAEAAMIGALADWFAVVALFRHPLGISWIPHTAIIQKNKDKIGDSLSGFVVSNFFTEEIIRSKLERINFSENVTAYLRSNKEELSQRIVTYLPNMIQLVFNSEKLSELVHTDLKSRIRNTEIYPYAQYALQAFVSSELHIPVIKQVLVSVHQWTSENKEKTMNIIEGMNTKFSFSIVNDAIYKFIVRMLAKLLEDMENGPAMEFNKEILYHIPAKMVEDFRTSKELGGKVEALKNGLLESESFDRFIDEKLAEIREVILQYCQRPDGELSTRLIGIFDYIIEDFLGDEGVRQSMDVLIKDSIVHMVRAYRHEIGALISDTVNNWPMEDMVDKLETQVGGDLQYIRINGTVIGGLAGLAIHWLSLLF